LKIDHQGLETQPIWHRLPSSILNPQSSINLVQLGLGH
jgi:hypothetical protein